MGRYLPLVMPALVGIILSTVAFWSMWARETDAIAVRYRNSIENQASAIEDQIDDATQLLIALAAYVGTAESFDQDHFQAFVQAALSVRQFELAVQALEWIPRIVDAQRADFEETTKRGGYPAFQITERTSQGRIQRAAARREYFPVHFVEPYLGNEAALGFDLASNPTRLRALIQARDTGSAVSTARITLVQEQAGQFAFLVFVPVYRFEQPVTTIDDRRRHLLGFTLGVFRIGALIEHAIANSVDQDIYLELSDPSAETGGQFLYADPVLARQEEGAGELVFETAVDVVGRKWLISATPTAAYFSTRRTWQPWAVGLIGLLLTVILCVYLAGNLRHFSKTERLVAKLAHEIDERKRAEIEHMRVEEQLLQAQKMEAIGQLAGGIAHDFNNLLTVVQGFAGMALERHAPTDPTHGDLTHIQTAVRRAVALTGQLLTFARGEMVQTRVLDLNRVVDNMAELLQITVGGGIQLSTILDSELGCIKADAGHLEQIVVNLAVNARDAMANTGNLTVETANVELDQGYANRHVGVTPGPYVLLSVSDTGCGMDEETQNRIFEPFFTTKEKGKGTGLGLATVYGIVKRSGGHIRVHSEAGLGTTFKAYFPRVEEAIDEDKEGRNRNKSSGDGAEMILLVEDNEDVRELAERVLAEEGYEVLVAAHPHKALEVCEQCDGPIHLLLTDIVMPGMNGAELARRISVLRPGIRVLCMSGYTGRAFINNGRSTLAAPFLQKPFTPYDLRRKVREVLDAAEPVTSSM